MCVSSGKGSVLPQKIMNYHRKRIREDWYFVSKYSKKIFLKKKKKNIYSRKNSKLKVCATV